MITHVWTVACRSAVIDGESGNISLEQIVEQVTINGLPGEETVVPLQFDVASYWVRSDPQVPAVGEVQIGVRFPDGEQIPLIVAPVRLDLSSHHRMRTRIHLDALPVKGNGRQYLIVEFRESADLPWRPVSDFPITIFFAPPDTGET